MAGAVVRRSDVPNAWSASLRAPVAPKARINRNGTLYLSVAATEAIGDQDCRVIAEFDEAAQTLKFTVAGQNLPAGMKLGDLFLMRIRLNHGNRHPIGMISIRALLAHLGVKVDGPQDFEIVALDRASRSITVAIP